MVNELLIAANSFISLCYFAIAGMMALPLIRAPQKNLLVLATILIFLSCALGHGAHVLLMLVNPTHNHSSFLLTLQLGIDLMTAVIAATYIALRRYYSFLVDGPYLLSQTQDQLAQANAQLATINTTLETQVSERTAELLKVNAQLAASEARFQKLAANVPGMIYQFQLDPNGTLTFPYVSSGCRELYELEPEVIQQDATSLTQVVHPDDRDSLDHSIADSAQTLQTWQWQGRIITASQKMKWLQGISRPEQKENGAIVWDGLLIDISERKQAEAERKQAEDALRRSNALLQAQQEAALDGILVVDENNQVVLYNQRFYQVWQIPEALVQQGDDRKILEVVVTKPQDPKAFLAKVDFLYEHPELVSRDEIVLKDGRILDRYTTSVRSSTGDYYGRVWYFRDISERKQAEASLQQSEARLRAQTQQLQQALDELKQTQSQLIQSEKMSSLGQLVAGVAHEINNPIGFIYGNLSHAAAYSHNLLHLLKCYQQQYPQPTPQLQAEIEQIDLEFLEADLPQLFASMQTGAERIREIVCSLRTFSRLDEAQMKAIDLHDGIESTLMILQNRLRGEASTPRIQVIKEYGKLPLVECYAGQLNQVFMNVLGNALDALESYSQCLTPTIWIRTEVLNSGWVGICIADNGPGIPDAVRDRIFDPFFTTKPIGQGTGLGLSISYQVVVEKHNGKLRCTSSLNQGTKFWLEIPIRQS